MCYARVCALALTLASQESWKSMWNCILTDLLSSSGARLPTLQPLTALEQWKASKHWLLWVAVVNHNVGKRNASSLFAL